MGFLDKFTEMSDDHEPAVSQSFWCGWKGISYGKANKSAGSIGIEPDKHSRAK